MTRFTLPLVALAVALSAAAPAAAAQSNRRPQAARPGQHQTADNGRRADRQLAAIDRAVNLSSRQERQVRDILRQDLSERQTDARILRVLTDRQDAAYRRLRSGRDDDRGRGNDRRDDRRDDRQDDRRDDRRDDRSTRPWEQ